MEFFDSHAHYNDEKFETDKEEILKQVYNSGVTKLICAGYSLESSKQANCIAKEHDFIYSIVGISPNDIPFENEQINNQNEQENIQNEVNITETERKDESNKVDINKTKYKFEIELSNQIDEIKKLAQSKKTVAIGEIGLDYYWNKQNKEEQKLAFCKQIQIANELNLPIVIHTREAIYDTLDILKNKITPNKKGVFHCCPLNIDLICEGLKLGFYISFAGPITFKNSKNAIEAIKSVPLDKILIETDSPYLAPEPKRGTRNDSRNVKYIAQKIAEVKNVSLEEISKITYENAKRIFEI